MLQESSPYLALARKYRPSNFEDVVGQEHVIAALQHSIDNNRIHHAYLLTGTRGIGKTTIARIIAKCLECEGGISSHPHLDGNLCSTCKAISEGTFPDVIEIDGASQTKVDDTRQLLENTQYPPMQGRYKVYIIDEVHMLSQSSFNALLKTLEEPPAYVKFILATTDPQKIPTTVLSRCLQFQLKALSIDEIASQIEKISHKEGFTCESEAAILIARAARGSMRDALSLCDQALALGNGKILRDTVLSMLGTASDELVSDILSLLLVNSNKSLEEVLLKIRQISPNYKTLLNDLVITFHDLALYQMMGNARSLNVFSIPSTTLDKYAKLLSPKALQLYYQIALQGLEEYKVSNDGATTFEMAILRLLAFTPEKKKDWIGEEFDIQLDEYLNPIIDFDTPEDKLKQAITARVDPNLSTVLDLEEKAKALDEAVANRLSTSESQAQVSPENTFNPSVQEKENVNVADTALQNATEVLAEPSLQQDNTLDFKESALNTSIAVNVSSQDNKLTESLTTETSVEQVTEAKAQTLSSVADTNAVAHLSSFNQDSAASTATQKVENSVVPEAQVVAAPKETPETFVESQTPKVSTEVTPVKEVTASEGVTAQSTAPISSAANKDLDLLILALENQQSKIVTSNRAKDGVYSKVLNQIIKPKALDIKTQVDAPTNTNLTQVNLAQSLNLNVFANENCQVDFELIEDTKEYINLIRKVTASYRVDPNSTSDVNRHLEGMSSLINDMSNRSKLQKEQAQSNFVNAISKLPSFDEQGNIVNITEDNTQSTPAPQDLIEPQDTATENAAIKDSSEFSLQVQTAESDIDRQLREAQEAALKQIAQNQAQEEQLKAQVQEQNQKLHNTEDIEDSENAQAVADSFDTDPQSVIENSLTNDLSVEDDIAVSHENHQVKQVIQEPEAEDPQIQVKADTTVDPLTPVIEERSEVAENRVDARAADHFDKVKEPLEQSSNVEADASIQENNSAIAVNSDTAAEKVNAQGTVINTEPGQVSVNTNTLAENLQDNPQASDSIELELVSFDDNYKVDSCQKVYVKNSMPSLSLVLAKVSQNYVPTKEDLSKTNEPYPTSLQQVLDEVMQGRFGTNQNVVNQQVPNGTSVAPMQPQHAAVKAPQAQPLNTFNTAPVANPLVVSTQKEQFKSELGKVTIANKPTEQRSKDAIINEAKAQSDVVAKAPFEDTPTFNALEDSSGDVVDNVNPVYDVEDEEQEEQPLGAKANQALFKSDKPTANSAPLSVETGIKKDGDPKDLKAATIKLLQEDQQFENRRLGRKLTSKDFYNQVEALDDWFKTIHKAGYNDGPVYASLCFSNRIIDPKDQYKWTLQVSTDFKLLLDSPDYHHNLRTKFSICLNHPVEITLVPVDGMPSGCPEDLANRCYLKEIENTRLKIMNNKHLNAFLEHLGEDARTVNLTLYTQENAVVPSQP